MTAETISDRQFFYTEGVEYFFLFLFVLYLWAWGMKTHKAVYELKTDLRERCSALQDSISSRFSGQSEIRDLTSKIDTLQSQLNSSLKARVDALEQKMKEERA